MIWSLVDGNVIEIMNPKSFVYRNDKSYMALTSRKDGKEWCSVYDTRTWKQITVNKILMSYYLPFIHYLQHYRLRFLL